MLAVGGGRPDDHCKLSLPTSMISMILCPEFLQRNEEEASLRWEKVTNIKIKCTKNIPLLPL